jgi:hypothetical protein
MPRKSLAFSRDLYDTALVMSRTDSVGQFEQLVLTAILLPWLSSSGHAAVSGPFHQSGDDVG